MVKNTKGGNHKFLARKDSYSYKTAVRIPIDPSERFAKVSKLVGGKLCIVITDDDITIPATIRGKFSGKFKRANHLSVGSFVLIGIHDWNLSKPSADILEIYSANDVLSLSYSFSFFLSVPSYHNIISFHDSHITHASHEHDSDASEHDADAIDI